MSLKKNILANYCSQIYVTVIGIAILPLYIKYMVSLRCKMMVKEELMKLGLQYVVIELGTVELLQPITPTQKKKLKDNLLFSGVELLDDKKSILIEIERCK